MAAGVSIDHVTFGYGATPVLDDVALEIAEGEFFAFLGPSGSGKTTLLRLVAGFGRPNKGRMLIGGRDVTRLPPWERNLGMVFQSYALWPHMTVAKNVAFGLERRNVSRAERARRVEEALALVGLSNYAGRRPAQLSGGQQQRVALARTLVIEPEVLLLDEPLSNLDAKLRTDMRAEIRALQRKLKLTAIYVTHDQEEANAIADRLAVLEGGRIQQVGTPLALYDNPSNRFVATFLGTANLIEGEIGPDRSFKGPSGFSLAGVDGDPGKVCLSVRPQAIMLAAAPSDAATTVTMREFLGGIVRYRVRAADQDMTVDVPHRRGEPAFSIGAPVVMTVDPRQVAVLR